MAPEENSVFPPSETLGYPPYDTSYELKLQEALVDFSPELSAPEIAALLEDEGLRDKFRRCPWAPEARARSARKRWLWKLDATPDWIPELNRKYPEHLRATPVYYAARADDVGALHEIDPGAAAPRLGGFVVEIKDGAKRRRVIAALKRLGLKCRARPGGLLDRFAYFTRRDGPGEGPEDFDLLAEIRGTEGVAAAELDWRTLRPLFEDRASEQVLLDAGLRIDDPAASEGQGFWRGALDDDALRRAAQRRMRAQIGFDDEAAAVVAAVTAAAVGDGGAETAVPVAVIDSGFDLAHPGLRFAVRERHWNGEQFAKGKRRRFNAGTGSSPHGTAVAGVCAAADPAGVTRGVAAGFPMIPAKLPATPSSWDLALAVNWAVRKGARVVNMSLHVAPGFAAAKVLEAASRDAVLCAATGNYYRSSSFRGVEFPARHEAVIAVGAVDACGKRQEPVAGREGLAWGSRYAEKGGDPGPDVVAPGTFCWTTDLRGAPGYNPGGPETSPHLGDVAGDYTVFHGTSAATPHVAGLAALVFARHPHLSAAEVREQIERTCRKLAPYRFALARPNGTWDDEVGYGLINVTGALTGRPWSPPR